MNKKVAAISIKNNESEISLLIEKLELSSLFLWKILDLANHMFWIHTVFHLILRKLIVHLVNYIFSCLGVIQSLSWNENWRLLLWLLLLSLIRDLISTERCSIHNLGLPYWLHIEAMWNLLLLAFLCLVYLILNLVLQSWSRSLSQ